MKIFLIGFFIIANSIFANAQIIYKYYYTGTIQNYIVPHGQCKLKVRAWGAGGGGGGNDVYLGGFGGGGAFAENDIYVNSGDTLKIFVGGYGVGGSLCGSLTPGGIGGWGYGIGGNGGSSGPVGCSGSGGGAGGSSAIIINNNIVLAAAGGGGGGGGGCTSAGSNGGAGGQNGYPSTCQATAGIINGSINANGVVGGTTNNDGGGAGGGGGGVINGGGGGLAPPPGPSCNALNDCGATGGAGGDSYGLLIINGFDTMPGNLSDTLLPIGLSKGGRNILKGANGFVYLYNLPNQINISLNPTICSTNKYTLPSGKIVDKSGIYYDTIKNNFGCDTIYTANLTVMEMPSIELGNDTTLLCTSNNLLLDISKSSGNYLWNDLSKDSIKNIVQSGFYNVRIDNPPCPSVYDSISITIIDCTTCTINFPNAFTPNDDGTNDYFSILTNCPIKRSSIQIFNRWGQIVFESSQNEFKWDGKYLDINQPMDVYAFKASIEKLNGEIKIINGNITLIR